MPKNRQLVPAIEGDDRLQHRRQVFGLAQNAAPFAEPSILIPVQIVDERIFLGSTPPLGDAWPRGIFDRRL